MRLFCLLLLPCCLQAADITLKLDSINGKKYAEQIREQFDKKLATERKLADAFRAYQNPSSSARLNPIPKVQSMCLDEQNHANVFRFDGTRSSRSRIILYYSFEEGYSKGDGTQSGVFANFELITKNVFHANDDDTEAVDVENTVEAHFMGFSLEVQAARPGFGIEEFNDEQQQQAQERARKNLLQEQQDADKALNQVYRQLLDQYGIIYSQFPDNCKRFKTALVEAQRNWCKFRDSELELLLARNGACDEIELLKLEMIKQRVNKLQQILDKLPKKSY